MLAAAYILVGGVVEVADIDAGLAEEGHGLLVLIGLSTVIERMDVADILSGGDGVAEAPGTVIISVAEAMVGEGEALGAVGGAPGGGVLIDTGEVADGDAVGDVDGEGGVA